jgi:hypothetical protein
MDGLTQKLVNILIDTVEGEIDSEGTIFGDEVAIRSILREAKDAGYTVSTTFKDLEESVLEVNADVAGNPEIKLTPIPKRSV